MNADVIPSNVATWGSPDTKKSKTPEDKMVQIDKSTNSGEEK
jgi:hypothetical protein